MEKKNKPDFVRVGLFQGDLTKPLEKVDTTPFYDPSLDFIVFPEYFGISANAKTIEDALKNTEKALDFYCNLSKETDAVIIGGSVLEKVGKVKPRLYNTSFIFYKGRKIGKYRKRNPYGREKGLIYPGNRYLIIEEKNIVFSVLICADILNAEDFAGIGVYRPDIIFLPTTSPYRPDDTVYEKYKRDEVIYLKNAKLILTNLAKCCGVGEVFGTKLQGRSLVATPNGIIFRVKPEEEDKEKWIVVDVPILK